MASQDSLSEMPFHIVGVLDGHDTDSASDLVSKLLPGAVAQRVKEGFPISQAYMEAFAEMEEKLKKVHATAGTCVNSCTIAGGRVWCANLGDCRTALVTLEAPTFGTLKAEAITWLSRDHRASCPIEQKRIAAAGGSVIDGRVEGLEPSRTLGDFDVKMTTKPGVISIVPEIRSVDLGLGGSAIGRRAVLMCATDGVWDVMSGQELCKIMCARKELGSFFLPEAVLAAPRAGLQALDELAEDIVQFALARGSRDDCTCLVAMISVVPEWWVAFCRKIQVNLWATDFIQCPFKSTSGDLPAVYLVSPEGNTVPQPTKHPIRNLPWNFPWTNWTWFPKSWGFCCVESNTFSFTQQEVMSSCFQASTRIKSSRLYSLVDTLLEEG